MRNKTYNSAYDEPFIDCLRCGKSITEPYYLAEKIPAIYVWCTNFSVNKIMFTIEKFLSKFILV